MNIKFLSFVFMTLFALTGCATRTYVDEKVVTSATKLSSPMYIYSFLDIRAQELGPKMVVAIHSQLEKRLGESAINNKLIEFRQTEVGRSFSVTSQGTPVPVKETYERNRATETEFGAKNRLIVFPRSVTVTNSGKFYSIDWSIRDITTDKEVWFMSYSGSGMNFLTRDDFPDERAKEIVDGLFHELAKRGALSK